MKPLRVPKRIIHCSDGVIEEFSSSSSDDDEEEKVAKEVNPSTMSWAEWAVYCAKTGLSSSFKLAEYAGGRIADFAGITAPVYQYEIEEYYRMQEEEQARLKAEADECRTRALEHARVESSHPFFISMSNDRTKLNNQGQLRSTGKTDGTHKIPQKLLSTVTVPADEVPHSSHSELHSATSSEIL